MINNLLTVRRRAAAPKSRAIVSFAHGPLFANARDLAGVSDKELIHDMMRHRDDDSAMGNATTRR